MSWSECSQCILAKFWFIGVQKMFNQYEGACVNLKLSVGTKRPQSWKASSSVRDTSSLASSSELMSSMQVSSWFRRCRRNILDFEPWDAELLLLSDLRRGLCVTRSMFETKKKSSSDVWCCVFPQAQEGFFFSSDHRYAIMSLAWICSSLVWIG